MFRWDVIQFFISKFGYKNYLEIGIQEGKCFSKIKCHYKAAVDPDPKFYDSEIYKMTSDEYFKKFPDNIYDIVFIDGLHHSEQVLKDVENALKITPENGTIILHDCLPTTEKMQQWPRNGAQEWTGDVWKAVVKLSEQLDLQINVLDYDYGIGIIHKNHGYTILPPCRSTKQLVWEDFEKNKNEWLNIINFDGFNKIYDRV